MRGLGVGFITLGNDDGFNLVILPRCTDSFFPFGRKVAPTVHPIRPLMGLGERVNMKYKGWITFTRPSHMLENVTFDEYVRGPRFLHSLTLTVCDFCRPTEQSSHRTVSVVYTDLYSNPKPLIDGSNGFL